MMKEFVFEFEDQSSENKMTYEYSDFDDEFLSVSIENQTPTIYMNRSAMLALAKVLLKIALGSYSDGFHIHLSRNFDADESEALRVVFSSSGNQPT